MSWARWKKRVFGVEIESCTRCGGELKIIASIEEPQLIAKILSHLERAGAEQSQSELAWAQHKAGYAHRSWAGWARTGGLKFLSAVHGESPV